MKFKNNLSIMLICLVVSACGGGGSSSNGDADSNASDDVNASRKEILTNIGDVVNEDFVKLNNSVGDFSSALNTYCDTAVDTEAKASVQSSFKTLMANTQKTMMYQFGPAVKNNRLAQVYSWPTTDTCLIDLQLAQNNLTAQTAVNKRGIDAIEYLLHPSVGVPFSCKPENISSTNLSQLNDFNDRPAADKKASRCGLMKSMTSDVAKNTQFIVTDWSSYQQTLAQATEITVFLNLITDSMFYFEETLKEFKLGRPLGGLPANPDTIPSCGAGVVCPGDRESKHAMLAKENIVANMKGFQTIFYGANVADKDARMGFDDWLIELGETQLANEMGLQIQDTIDALNDLEGTLGDNFVNNTSKVQSILDNKVSLLGRNLKEVFIQSLGLELPSGSGSDTD